MKCIYTFVCIIDLTLNKGTNIYIKSYETHYVRKSYEAENIIVIWSIRVITKLPNSEQSYKGKVKTHKYINRQNQSTT